MTLDLAVTGGRVVLPGGVAEADVGIANGTIAVVSAPGLLPPTRRVIDATGHFVLPGLVDPHTHPGNFRPLLPDIASETRSAALGGVTTMIGTIKVTRMPDDSPEVTRPEDAVSYLDQFQRVRQRVDQTAHVDVAFSFVCMTPQHVDEIPAYVTECGVTSFKFFLTNPPSTASGGRVGMPVFPDEGTVFRGFRACAAAGALAMVHAENGVVIHVAGAELAAGREGLDAWEARFPGVLEASEIRKAAYFAQITGAHYYAVHVTSTQGLAAISEARRQGVAVSAETCPQYLVLDLENSVELGPLAKFNPPIRAPEHRQALWEGLASGAINAIGSDHVPNLRARKMPDVSVENAVAGSGGVATSLPLLWTHGVSTGRISIERLTELLCVSPARLFGLYPRKGIICPGSDGDLVILDPNERRTVDPGRLHSWADCSAYEGMELVGWPTLTILGGEVIAQEGQPVGPPRGRYLRRPLK